ncbi:hypothetical protein COO91_08693 [Nostoc flagelliforme CCNUN1]|uniref:Uncharacterized protein n=1 Tax=Nostoc flagelliforme CCNUN1 TaxID=2038116 RepID=A0A2K8T4F7_9NOSO|nr:hypothetical protein COO91_08693 [Nostoc flagelliforme CCNUN1]
MVVALNLERIGVEGLLPTRGKVCTFSPAPCPLPPAPCPLPLIKNLLE